MATGQDFVEHVLGQAGLGAALSPRKMFGEYGFYLDGKFVAIAADNMLFVKPTGAGRRLVPAMAEAPPYPGAKSWLLADEALDDPDLLRRLLQATAAALPAAGKK